MTMQTPTNAGSCCGCTADQSSILGSGTPSDPFHVGYTQLEASGSSSSATPGTPIASIAAAAGKKIVAWSLVTGQSNATGTQLTVTITYSDSTTTVVTTAAASAQAVYGNAGGLLILGTGAFISVTALSAKDITSIEVTTAGTGVGIRAAIIAGLQG